MIVPDYHIKDGQSDYHIFSPELTTPGFFSAETYIPKSMDPYYLDFGIYVFRDIGLTC